jgi:hypothetical protein
MFVRWKRRQRKATWEWDPGWDPNSDDEPTGKYVEHWVKSAVLLESARTPSGPRHKYVCYLGSIREDRIQSHWERKYFWEAVAQNLKKLDLSEAEDDQILAAMEVVVPLPDAEGLEAESAETMKILQGIGQHLGGPAVT